MPRTLADTHSGDPAGTTSRSLKPPRTGPEHAGRSRSKESSHAIQIHSTRGRSRDPFLLELRLGGLLGRALLRIVLGAGASALAHLALPARLQDGPVRGPTSAVEGGPA